MRVLKTIALEIWGLFVDDGAFAAAVVIWLIVAGVAARHFAHVAWIAPAFFVGLVVILAAGAIRQAKRVKK